MWGLGGSPLFEALNAEGTPLPELRLGARRGARGKGVPPPLCIWGLSLERLVLVVGEQLSAPLGGPAVRGAPRAALPGAKRLPPGP